MCVQNPCVYMCVSPKLLSFSSRSSGIRAFRRWLREGSGLLGHRCDFLHSVSLSPSSLSPSSIPGFNPCEPGVNPLCHFKPKSLSIICLSAAASLTSARPETKKSESADRLVSHIPSSKKSRLSSKCLGSRSRISTPSFGGERKRNERSHSSLL